MFRGANGKIRRAANSPKNGCTIAQAFAAGVDKRVVRWRVRGSPSMTEALVKVSANQRHAFDGKLWPSKADMPRFLFRRLKGMQPQAYTTGKAAARTFRKPEHAAFVMNHRLRCRTWFSSHCLSSASNLYIDAGLYPRRNCHPLVGGPPRLDSGSPNRYLAKRLTDRCISVFGSHVTSLTPSESDRL